MAIAVMLAATAAGCRSNNTQVMVEQEARMLEDEVYSLESQLASACSAREALQQENEDLRRQLSGGSGGGLTPPARELPSSGGSRRSAPTTEAPKLEAPSIELPEPSSTPPDTLVPGDEQPVTPGPMGALDRQPVELKINKRMTGGLDRDRAGGDEGILVLVEPRDDQGKLTRVPGAVSVVLMDPSQTGEGSRVARWDFQAHEFEKHFKKSPFGTGLEYELKWPKEAPTARDLMLFVRYISPEGTKLTSDTPLAIRLAGDYPRESKDALASAEAPAAPTASAQPAEAAPADSQEVAANAGSPSGRSESPASGRALIPPRQARDTRPQWKPYR
jgi:hypothetical protein